MKKVIILVLILLATGLFFATRNNSQQMLKNDGIPVTASFYPLYYFTSEIGKDKVEVSNLTPAGSEPHDYEPTAKDIARIEKSKLLIINGSGFEPWYGKIQEELKQKNVRIIEATQGLDLMEGQEEHEGEEEDEEHAEEENVKDPHVWLSPVLASKQVEKINATLSEVDPQSRELYTTNAKLLKDRLSKLDASFREGLKNCKQKNIITTHTAFAYLAKEYGLNQVAISGLSPEEEPTSKQLAEVSEFAKTNDVKYIFFESLVSPKLAETIASEIGAKTLVLDPIEGLSDDDIKQGKNYFTVMEDNLKNLQIALQCDN